MPCAVEGAWIANTPCLVPLFQRQMGHVGVVVWVEPRTAVLNSNDHKMRHEKAPCQSGEGIQGGFGDGVCDHAPCCILNIMSVT